MKPFNLDEALAGKKVITRDGREVTQLHLFDAKFAKNKLWGVINGNVFSWTEDGRYSDKVEMPSDLFMAPEKKEYWVNVYRDTHSKLPFAGKEFVFESEQIAKEHIVGNDYLATVKIWEEEV